MIEVSLHTPALNGGAVLDAVVDVPIIKDGLARRIDEKARGGDTKVKARLRPQAPAGNSESYAALRLVTGAHSGGSHATAGKSSATEARAFRRPQARAARKRSKSGSNVQME